MGPLRRLSPWVFVAVAAAAIVAAAALIGPAVAPRAAPPPTPRPPPSIGQAAACRQAPKFAEALGYSRNAALDSSDSLNRNIMGLALIDLPAASSSAQPRVYRHPTWDDFGHLGPIVVAWDGAAYTVPTPRINVFANPLGQQNRVLRVDPATGALTEFLRLPDVAPSTQANPYGALGLAIDCDTRSLYVATVAGSDGDHERGRVYRIDLSGPQPQITSQLAGVDALGLGVFKGSRARRLYFGALRAAEIRSVVVDDKGDFYGDVRTDAVLAGLSGDGEDKARRISFSNTEMQVRGMEFSFNLVASREKVETRYTFVYDAPADAWRFTGAAPADKGQP